MNISLVEAESHLAELLHIEEKCFERAYRASDFLGDPAAAILLAREGEAAVGYIYLHRSIETIEIYRLAVTPPFRRRGIGAALVSEAVKLFYQEQGVERLLLEVKSSNTAALELYRQAGFVPFHLRAHYYSDGSDAVEMQYLKEKRDGK